MSNNLESLVKQAETDISSRSNARRPLKKESLKAPKLSVAITIWLLVIFLGAYQFDTVASIFSTHTESQIERDLGTVLIKADSSLRNYEINTGSLPPILPNAAIRGLVKYERHSDFSYRLTATISNVTMVMDSTSTSPHRQAEAK
jgi:hypothetical protein